MRPDNQLDEALRSLAGQAARTGRLANAADIRHRSDTRRKRRRAATAALAVSLAGLLTTGIAVAWPNGGQQTGPPPAQQSPAATTDPTMSGNRRVTIVRVQASESGLSLTDDGRLTEVDDDSGRQLFVLTPLGADSYLIRTAQHGSDGTPSCWRARANGSNPLTVAAAACSANDPLQKFTITVRGHSDGQRTYAIANDDAFLQYSRQHGLILEELGDANLTTTFRLIDNGAAPTPGN